MTEEQLQTALSRLVPQAHLRWQRIPELPLEGFVLDLASASAPLDTETSRRVMNAPPFWGLLWPAGYLLCRLFTKHAQVVRGRSCVDLGCGSGLASVASALAGARVVAVDLDPLSCQVTQLHLERHRVEGRVASGWRGRTQTLLLADFLYDESNLEALDVFLQRTEEILIVDCRLEDLSRPGFHFLGQSSEIAFPDLDPHREFGTVRVWYSGARKDEWADAFELSRIFES